MSKSLPERPNLDHLREQAKELISSFRAGDLSARDRLSASLPGYEPGKILALHDAQSVVAREYGFPSWKAMADEVEVVRAREGITPDVIRTYVDALLSDHWLRAERLMSLYPGLPKADLACALASGEVETVLTWLDGDAARVTEPLGSQDRRPICLAARSRVHRLGQDRYEGQLACVRLLLDRGAHPNTGYDYGSPAPGGAQLHVLFDAAGESGHVGIVRELLLRGAKPNDGESVYHAAEHNRREVLEVLAEFGADLGGPDSSWGNTPVSFLCSFRENYPTVGTANLGIEWLLEHGANPNVKLKEHGETALHVACRNGRRVELIKLLCEHGADIDARRDDGRTPYALACITGNDPVAAFLREAGASVTLSLRDGFLRLCAEADEQGIARVLAEAPSVREEAEEEARKLFVDFAEWGNLTGMQGMHSAGYPFASEGRPGSVPLHAAAFRAWLPCIEWLLATGASATQRDEEHNSTAFGWAIYGSAWNRNNDGDYPTVVRLLLEAGTPREDARRELDFAEVPEDVKAVIREFLG